MFFIVMLIAFCHSSALGMELKIESYKECKAAQEKVCAAAKNGIFLQALVHTESILSKIDSKKLNSWTHFTLQAGAFAYLSHQIFRSKEHLEALYSKQFDPSSHLEFKKVKAGYYLAQIALDANNLHQAFEYLSAASQISLISKKRKEFYITVMNDLAELYKLRNDLLNACSCYENITRLAEEFPHDAAGAQIDLKRLENIL
ncbi:MAG: hypothetical protein ACOYT8_00395 [Candidatus Dependentiae bacterium]